MIEKDYSVHFNFILGDQVWVLWSNIYYRGKILEPGIDHYYYVHFWKYSKK